MQLYYPFLDAFADIVADKFYNFCIYSKRYWEYMTDSKVSCALKDCSYFTYDEYWHLQCLFDHLHEKAQIIHLIWAGKDAQFELKEQGLTIPVNIVVGYITFYAKNGRKRIPIKFHKRTYESYTILYLYDRVMDLMGRHYNISLAAFVRELVRENIYVCIDSARSSWSVNDTLLNTEIPLRVTPTVVDFLSSRSNVILKKFFSQGPEVPKHISDLVDLEVSSGTELSSDDVIDTGIDIDTGINTDIPIISDISTLNNTLTS